MVAWCVLTRENPILLIDADCVLCNRAAKFVIRHDRGARVLFAGLNSPRADAIFQERGLSRPPSGTAVLVIGRECFVRSEAILRVLCELPPPWSWLGALARKVPVGLRDTAYMVISRLRIVLFGRTQSCGLMTESERRRFLG